jgi:hypothetical protein
MNTNKLLVTLASVVFAVASSTAVVACSSDDSSNPAPAPLDASTGNDTGAGADTGATTDSGGHADTGTTTDSGTPDTGPCTSDAATCNSCVTAATDPLHACSPATANCIPFDNTRVPANVPQP